jgi:hypothetical protein
MGWRFQKRIKIAPGLRLNISKSALSLTGGVEGASVSLGKDGQHINLGAPGTGLSTRTKLGRGKAKESTSAKPSFDGPTDAPGIGWTLAALVILGLLLWGAWSLAT